MQSRDNKRIEENRDLELENIVGNLLIAEYQIDKLRTRLADLVDVFRPKMRFNKVSTHVFKHNDKWYKISLRIDETNVTPSRDNLGQNNNNNNNNSLNL
jgi:hypothetical protein